MALELKKRKGSLRRVVDLLWLGYAVVGAVAVLGLLMLVVVDVLLRYLVSGGIDGTSAMVSSWFMVSIAFTGIALAQRYGGTIQVDLLMDAASGRVRQIVDGLVLIGIAIIALLFAWFGWQEALHQTEVGEYAPIGERPLWPFRFLVPLGFLGFALACVLSLVDLVRRGPIEVSVAESASHDDSDPHRTGRTA